jgi:hypothetical protein
MTVWNVTSCSKGKKCKVVPVHAMKAYWGSKGIAPFILNPGLFTKEKDSWYLKPKTYFMYQEL